MKADAAQKYKNRFHAKEIFRDRKKQEEQEMTVDPLEEMFHGD